MVSALLAAAVIWPLLLAGVPPRWRPGGFRWLALLPAAVLLLWPADGTLTLSRWLLGIGLGLAGPGRWLLAMAVIVGSVAATVRDTPRRDTFFLLSLAGQLGAILATEPVAFFASASVMGYGFYGLFADGGGPAAGDATRGAACLYVSLLVLADLALFEALLLAAAEGSELRFAAVRDAMVRGAHASAYVSMVLIGFALKAGLWPTHLWLTAGFGTVPRRTAVLFAGVPVAIGLLGAVRWLPLGGPAGFAAGAALAALGMAGVLAGAWRLVACRRLASVAAALTVAGTGALFAVIGIGLVEPTLWQRFGTLVPPAIALFGIVGGLLSRVTQPLPSPAVSRWERWPAQGWERVTAAAARFAVRRDQVQATVARNLRLPDRLGADPLLGRWGTTIGLGVLVGLLLALEGVFR